MFPSCFEVTHPILIRLTHPKMDPNRGDCFREPSPRLALSEVGFAVPGRGWGHCPQPSVQHSPVERAGAHSLLLSVIRGHLFNNPFLQSRDEPVSLPSLPSKQHTPLICFVTLGRYLLVPLSLVVSLLSALSWCQCLKCSWPSINGSSFSFD